MPAPGPNRAYVMLALPLLAASLAQAGDTAPSNKIELQIVKYSELMKAVKNLKGKIVVVDFWADT